MDSDIEALLKPKHLHGVYFVGHGLSDGLYTTNKWRTLLTINGKRILSIPVGFVKYADPGEQVLDFNAVGGDTDKYYHMAFGLIFACYSNWGELDIVGTSTSSAARSVFVDSHSRSGVIWQGDDNWFWVFFEEGMDVPEPLHVKHWIRPGDQGTQR